MKKKNNLKRNFLAVIVLLVLLMGTVLLMYENLIGLEKGWQSHLKNNEIYLGSNVCKGSTENDINNGIRPCTAEPTSNWVLIKAK